jgi:hypothetical protein
MRKYLDECNTLFIDNDTRAASAQIDDALASYGRFAIDERRVWSELCCEAQLPTFQAQLENRIKQLRMPIEGRWFLKDLHMRLPCHGQKFNYQIMHSDDVFFSWMERCSGAGYDPYDEEAMIGNLMPGDKPTLLDYPIFINARSLGMRVLRKIQRGH